MLLHYAGVPREEIHFFRIGTSGGLGVPPGTVVITDHVIDAAMRNHFYSAECGKVVPLPCIMNKEMALELQGCASQLGLATMVGGTMGTDDFYLGQGRLDGAFCDYGEKEKQEFIQKLHREYNIMNFRVLNIIQIVLTKIIFNLKIFVYRNGSSHLICFHS